MTPTIAQKTRAIALVRGGASYRAAAEAVGANRHTVAWWARGAGVRRGAGWHRRPAEDRERAISAYLAGMSLAQAGAVVGVTSTAVHAWMREAGVPRRPTPRWSIPGTWARAGAVLLALSGVAHAAPPPGAPVSPEVAAWFRELRSVRTGLPCCSVADCRRTAIETHDGRLVAWIGREQFGPYAPDAWMPVPAVEAVVRGDRPESVRGAVVCFYGGQVACADLDGGL